MPCAHTYRPLTTTTLSLPTREGIYEALIVYRCTQCYRVDAYSVALRQDRPMPTWDEINKVLGWQQSHPRETRQHRKL